MEETIFMKEAIISFVGIVLGWLLSELSTMFRSRIKLCLRWTSTPASELVEKSCRTDTSNSEYSLEVFNYGSQPFLIDYIDVLLKDGAKNKFLFTHSVHGKENAILPYQGIVCTFAEQDAEAMFWHCKQIAPPKNKVYTFSFIVHEINGKKRTAELDLPLIFVGL